MDSLHELYQETIMDHHQHPRNYGVLVDATHGAVGDNPLCGDHVEVALRIAGGKVTDIKFTGSGCAISRAAASLMTTVVVNKTPAQIRSMNTTMAAALTGKKSLPASLRVAAPLEGVKQFPARVKCATLSWHAVVAALDSRK